MGRGNDFPLRHTFIIGKERSLFRIESVSKNGPGEVMGAKVTFNFAESPVAILNVVELTVKMEVCLVILVTLSVSQPIFFIYRESVCVV